MVNKGIMPKRLKIESLRVETNNIKTILGKSNRKYAVE